GAPIPAFQLLVRDAKDDPSLFPLASEGPDLRPGSRPDGREAAREEERARSDRDGATPGLRIVRNRSGRSVWPGDRAGGAANANDLRSGGGGRRANAYASEASRGASGAGEWHFFRNGEFRVSDIEAGTWIIEVVARGYTGVNVEV